MNLLDLPAEIFADIIHAHLQRSGWAAAVQARYVCKTFAAAVQSDMFGRCSARYYRFFGCNWKERLLGPNMHTLLFKMGAIRCNSTYILDHMEATVDFLMDFSYYKTLPQRERYRLALCNAVSAALSVDDMLAYLCDGPYDDPISIRKNMGRADTVGMLAAAAAAAVNSEPALRFLVGKVHDVGQRSELNGTLLTATAINGHKYATTFIYEHYEDSRCQWNQSYEAIDTCMYKQRATILPTLTDWYLKRYDSGKAICDAKHEWNKWAIARGELDMVRHCYNFKRATKSKRELRLTPFYLACEYGHGHMLKYFLQIDATLGDATHHYEEGRIGAHGLSQGLIVAVQHGWLVADRLLIESGAQIRKSECGDTVCAPALWHADERGHVDMVVLLLAYGAFVPEKSSTKYIGF
jgi:hypothetical protein